MLSDPTRSADSAFKRLLGLDTKFRSPALAVQVEAIGEFPKLLDQFPFPSLVNSAFLKLGDLFRTSPNALRYHIAQVFASSRHHLAQITQTEELLKRMLVVLYSNDSTARVLALRLLGNASSIFAHFPEAQHGILLRYQSSHPLEIAAAVQATEALLKYSPGFLEVVWETVLGKANDASVPDSVRVRLIHSLRHAAPRLQLSSLLYARCQSWVYQPSNTIALRSAAMDTWRSVLQTHNELQPDDAERISSLVLHDLASARHAALTLIGRWRPTEQMLASHPDCAAKVSSRLNSRVETLLQEDALDHADIEELRLAILVLARIEAASKDTSTASWNATLRFSAQAMRCFGADIARSTQRNSTDLASYRHLASSAILTISVAAISRKTERKHAAAGIVRDSWLAVSRTTDRPGSARYIRKFLRASWAWCVSAGVEMEIISSLGELLGSCSRQVASHTIAIVSSAEYFGHAAAECRMCIERFADALDLAGPERSASYSAWNSMSIALTHFQQAPSSALDGLDNSLCALATSTISKWAAGASACFRDTAAHSKFFAATGPPPWMVLKLMSLLATKGSWSTLYKLCQVLPASGLSDTTRSWLCAISGYAKAEASVIDTEAFQRCSEVSLNTLRALDHQGTPCRYRIFLIQLRRELVCLHSGWSRLQSSDATGPAMAYTAKYLASRMRSLIDQAEFVYCAFPLADPASRRWTELLQGSLQEAVRLLDESMASDPEHIDAHAATDNALAALGQQLPPFRPGLALLCEPPQIPMYIETQPNLEHAESPRAVLAGSQFHFVVEGFLRLPKCPLPASISSVRISVWLSRQPLGNSKTDLQMCTAYYTTARATSRAAGSDPGALWDQATVFSAPTDGAYFICPCTTPPLQGLLDHPGVNGTVVYLHILCSLAASSGAIWWTGPHASYPLLVSKTAS